MTFATGIAGNAAVELKDALDRAERARDGAASKALMELAFGHISEKLGRLSPNQLDRYLGTLQVWRVEDDCPVFRTVDEPAIAFTALEFDSGTHIVVLGVLYRNAASDEDWWRSTILPRLRLYL